MKYNKNCGGSEKQYDPRLVEEIVEDFLANSNSPFAVAYRARKAKQVKQKQQDWHPNTHLCVDLKTLLRHDSIMQPRKSYTGVLTRDLVCDEYLYDDQHFTFTETVTKAYRRKNPQVFNGKHITITRHENGSYRANLKPREITDGFDIDSYASEVANELMWALESLVRK